MQHPIHILERYWNFTSFRPLQEEIITSVLDKEDVFVLMPTAGGKSLCYQVPALMQEGICIVVSPLIALMKDQVQALKKKGIKAMALTSGIKQQELDTLLDNCIYGNYKFLYLSPERIQQELVQNRIRQMHVSFIAVDEAHCISQWGNDFRPAYKNIIKLRELKPHANVIALTATATPKVVDDVIEQLDFLQPKIYKQSFARPNIAFQVITSEDKLFGIEQALQGLENSAIIYVRNRKRTVEIANHLAKKGFAASFFHGGLTSNEKEEKLNDWLNNKITVMVATNAFGMGIDKADVACVIHVNLPESIESYFQEAGRAGRNGELAKAIILKNNEDETLIKQQFLSVLPTVAQTKIIYKKLCNYFQVSYGEGVNDTFEFNFYDFYKTYNFNSLITYNTLQLLDRTSVISVSQEFRKRSKVQFIINNNALFNYLESNMNIANIVKAILRTYGGIFDQEIKVNLSLVAAKANTSEQAVVNALQQLQKDEIISLKLSKTDSEITFLQPREDDKTIYRIAKTIEQQYNLKQAQVTSILNYISNDSVCKSVQLLSYFGEKNIEDCGICSVCKTEKPSANISVITKSIQLLLKTETLSSRQIANILKTDSDTISKAIQQLLEENIITITDTNTYKLKDI